MYNRVQWLLESAQSFGLKVPPAPLSLHDTIPIKAADGCEVSATVAVNVTAFPEADVAGFGVTVNVVPESSFVDNLNAPELGMCVPSPE